MPSVWVINGTVTTTHAVPLARVEHEGQTFITASDMGVYISHPLLNLFTGKTEEIWLTKEQQDQYRVRNDEGAPHDRTFELPSIGLPNYTEIRQSTAPRIEGFTRPDSASRVIQDHGGHWWAGSVERMSVRPYYIRRGKHEPPQLAFLLPYLRYLGADDAELWVPVWHHRNDQKDRLTLCTREVSKVIGEVGVWGFYYPQATARHDEALARKEAMKVAQSQVVAFDTQMTALRQKLEDTNVQLKTAEAALTVATRKADEAEAALSTARLKQKLAAAEERCRELEADLLAARSGKRGLNWSSV